MPVSVFWQKKTLWGLFIEKTKEVQKGSTVHYDHEHMRDG